MTKPRLDNPHNSLQLYKKCGFDEYRQREMNSYVARAWKQFSSFTAIQPMSLGIEFGCGTGINTVTIALEGFRIIGLDISAIVIYKANELANAHSCSAQFLVGDIFDSGLQSCSFDFALNIWTLHCVGEQNLRDKHLSECLRVLKPGGYIYLHNESSEYDILCSDKDVIVWESDI